MVEMEKERTLRAIHTRQPISTTATYANGEIVAKSY
jgi:hypothetical protein